jgi:integrase
MATQKKRLRAQVTVGHDADGTPIYKWANGRTKKELEANKEELRKAHINGAVAIRRDIFFGEYVTEWYRAYKEPYLSPSSKANYRSTLNHYLFPVFGDKQMRAITALQLQSYLNSLAGTGKTTLCYIMIILTNCFTLATAQGVIDRNAAEGLKPPKAERTSRRALTAQETAAVLKVIDTHPDGLLLAILYYTGLRRGEALGLRWSDIDFAARSLRVERDIDFVAGDVGTVKTDTSVRTVPVPDELMILLQKHRQIGNGYIIRAQRTGEFWSQSTFVRRWRLLQTALLEAARGIENNGSGSILTAHYFRHNYASILYRSGVDVLTAQRYLGHTDPTTTMRIYTHLAEETELKDAEKVRKAFS